jgi:hypothetical protein
VMIASSPSREPSAHPDELCAPPIERQQQPLRLCGECGVQCAATGAQRPRRLLTVLAQGTTASTKTTGPRPRPPGPWFGAAQQCV